MNSDKMMSVYCMYCITYSYRLGLLWEWKKESEAIVRSLSDLGATVEKDGSTAVGGFECNHQRKGKCINCIGNQDVHSLN